MYYFQDFKYIRNEEESRMRLRSTFSLLMLPLGFGNDFHVFI